MNTEAEESMNTQDREAPDFEQAGDVLAAELALTGRIAAIQAGVKQAALNREWADFEARMDELKAIGGEFEELDERRVRLFGGEADFYAQCARFPEEQRRTLAECFRRLKAEITKIRLENDALLQYIGETRTVIAGALDILFPERRGRLYSRRGMQVQADMRSMVFNKSL